MKRCLDCGTLYNRDTSPSGRCPPCHQNNRRTRDRMRDRPSATARGYGTEHKATRARMLAELADGTPC